MGATIFIVAVGVHAISDDVLLTVAGLHLARIVNAYK
jgi:hypothetical protein